MSHDGGKMYWHLFMVNSLPIKIIKNFFLWGNVLKYESYKHNYFRFLIDNKDIFLKKV